MRTGYPETEKNAACITLYLSFGIFVYGLFGLSFYEMLQPRHIANMGLAAYKPPLATVFGYDRTERVVHRGPLFIEEDASYETLDETAVASSSGSNRLGTEAGHNCRLRQHATLA